MGFTKYASTDGSAPTLAGVAGDLVNLWDKCLVAGYGAKPAAGWTKDFTGVNKAVFRPPSGDRLYFRCQDDAPGAGGAKEARITGYESMTDVDTGTGPFPTAAQGVGGVAMVVARKSTTADATTRAWKAFADARTAYFFALTGDGASIYLAHAIGEFYSLVPSDSFGSFIAGRSTENNASTQNAGDIFYRMAVGLSNHAGLWVARSYTGVGSSIAAGVHGDMIKGSPTGSYAGAIAYPNTADASILLSPVWVHHGTQSVVRGRMRGLWQLLHSETNYSDGDTIPGAGEYAGKTFEIVKGPSGGAFLIETSDTLETN